MACMASTLGAPVTDPQGNNAENTSVKVAPGRVRAATSLVMDQTVGSASA